MAKHLQQTKFPNHPFKYYDIIGMLAIAVILISNTVASKIMPLGPLNITVGLVVFPLAYLISDILTEVYGYARARRVTWMMFTCQVIMVISYEIAIAMPSASFWHDQESFAKTLGAMPRIAFASMAAVLVGDFINCYVMSKMKILTKGKHLWARTIASTFFGQGIDSMIFYTVAFYGVFSNSDMINTLLSCWFVKVAYEAILMPITYFVVNRMKRAEGIDHFDHGINYTPFTLKVDN